MNSLFTILKATFINDFGLNSFSKNIKDKEQKKKARYTLFSIILGVLVIGYLSTTYSLLLAETYAEFNALSMIVLNGILFSTILTFFSSIYKAQGSLFTSKDYDLLMSLPIKPSIIFTSKLINLLLMNWVFTLFVVVPSCVVYFIKCENLSYMFFFILLKTVLFIPIIPVILASLFAIIVAYFSSKLRFKNLVTIIGSIIVMISIIIVSFKLTDIMNYVMSNSSSVIEGIKKIYPPIGYLFNALVNVDIIEGSKFILISLLPFIAFVIIFSKSFKSINSRLSENYKKSNYKMSKLEVNTPLMSLVKKELRLYFAIPVYILNTFIGMIMLLIGAITVLFMGEKVLINFKSVPQIESYLPLIVLLVNGFCIGLTTTTCSAISLEGKNLWILKALPIDTKQIFINKIVVNLILTMPISIISNVLFFIGLKFSLLSLIFTIFISLAYCILCANLGLLINLYFPKLDFTTPTAVVKQSASVIINILLIFGMLGISIASFIIFKVKNINLFLIFLFIIINILSIIIIFMLRSSGVKKFQEL